ncbi:MAG TPA: polyhydroxyalkanoate synthesis regulator DNA-binding domain-containing protein [Anaeromyxobacter sp.]
MARPLLWGPGVLTTTLAPPPARVLRRYANRKIYDPEQSRYVNHAEIAALVRAGANVRVLDRRTARDVTGFALARILSLEEGGSAAAREATLFQLLRAASGEAPPPAVERGERRAPPEAAARILDGLLSNGQRGAFVARGWLAGQVAAFGRLEERARARGEAAASAVGALLSVKGQLERIARRLDAVEERLREVEGR